MQTAIQSLGNFLRARRLRLDPAAFGFIAGRRRTPGLRREEVAQLANISPTWYTWLEQGRGGAPSREVLNRIASGLRLTSTEREHLFILAFGHPPEAQFTISADVTPRLQRVLDAFIIPAIIKTVTCFLNGVPSLTPGGAITMSPATARGQNAFITRRLGR